MRTPTVSIITVVRNGAGTIIKTIDSVLGQSYQNVEYLVIDGGSTDGTVDILRDYGAKINYWVSEPDRGIYNAMNKGISLATGEWIYFLGADDTLVHSEILNEIFGNKHCCTDASLIYGDIEYNGGRFFRSSFSRSLLIKNTVHHQGAFYSSGLFKSFSYDERYSVYSDYELNLRLLVLKERAKRVNSLIAFCGNAGVSGVPKLDNYLEEIFIRRKYLGAVKSFPLDLLTILRWGGKRVMVCFR